MNDSKDFFASKSTWGAIFLLITPLLDSVGIQIDQGAVVDSITQLVGIVLFLWGQFTRKTEIGSIAGVRVKR